MSAKKISRRVREEAIEACLVAHELMNMSPWSCSIRSSVDDWLGGGPSSALAWSARDAAADAIRNSSGSWIARWLEAASLLRDGWSPGDPVEVLR